VTATPAWAVQLSAICAPGLMPTHAASFLEGPQKRCDGARGRCKRGIQRPVRPAHCTSLPIFAALSCPHLLQFDVFS
jgi:hypothetical protein